ncbi:serine/threonine-protein kinase [Stutzerimonas stutzeri]|uniref:serine/threonine-protein kinase n=1 Tax=Stutzerimonas stutzeri TaxID=316 RepID=UPI001C2E3B1F|nr:serine/threonine-protein kinase [Stutzerimonas stutzeri]
MNEPLRAEPSADLTYFAFAATAASPAAKPQAQIPPGASELPQVLAGRYRIERLLGVGGMGAVYRARDLLREQFGDPEPYVALKTLSDEFAEYPDAHALLYGEFALTARLSHRHVVRLFGFDVDTASERAFITLELLKGPTLDQLLVENPQGLAWPALRDIAVPLLQAVEYSHSRGVIHGDLKPSNVILADDGLRLFDYGLGQPIDGLLENLPRLSRNRFKAWTTRYAAPELLEGEEPTAASDLYALGCLLFELASGHHPYRRLSAKQARAMALDQELRRPPRFPAHGWPALRSALAFDPEARSASLSPLLDALLNPAPSRLQRWLGRAHG